jgi:hypothetical protein
MSLSYDGSLLYHLAAHMPLHCIIIVAPPSCPFVPLACLCLLCRLCHLHLCCASLFWLIVVFTPLSCLLPPPSPNTKKSLRHRTPHRERVMSSTPLLLSALSSFCCAGWLLHIMLLLLLESLPLLCPCQRPCCTGIIAVVALASLPSLPPTLPSSIAAVKQIFAAHPSFG